LHPRKRDTKNNAKRGKKKSGGKLIKVERRSDLPFRQERGRRQKEGSAPKKDVGDYPILLGGGGLFMKKGP